MMGVKWKILEKNVNKAEAYFFYFYEGLAQCKIVWVKLDLKLTPKPKKLLEFEVFL